MASAEGSENCNRILFEAVNEISVPKFKSTISSFSQIEVLTSFLQCNGDGETPLVIAMKGKNVDLIDELVKFIRLCDRTVAKCHEMSLIAIDQLFHHQIPIMELLEHLIKDPFVISIYEWSEITAQAVFKSTSLTRPDKIIALELIGASIRSYYFGIMAMFAGIDGPWSVVFRCWREAMSLRQFPGEPLLLKIPYVGVSSVASSVVLGSAEEVMTMEDLNLLQEGFERDVVDRDVQVRKRCTDLLRRQCFLVMRRISSQANHGHPHSFYLQSLFKFGSSKIEDLFRANAVDAKIPINTFLLILEQMTDGVDPKLLPRYSVDIFIKTLGLASHCFALMAMEPPDRPEREELNYANLLTLTKFIGMIAKNFPNPRMMTAIKFDGRGYSDYRNVFSKMSQTIAEQNYDGFAEIVYNLVFVLVYISPQLNNQQEHQIELHLSHYIRNYFLERTNSVLHAGVRCLFKRKFRTSDNLKPIKLLIKLGADPNAIDEEGRTPLHILVLIECYLDEKMLKLQASQFLRNHRGIAADNGHSDEYLPIFRALVDAGTHLDMAADNGNTVVDILKENVQIFKDGVIEETYFSTLVNKVFPLSCYCARVIRRHGLRFDEDRLPLHLQEFVSRHSAKDPIDLSSTP